MKVLDKFLIAIAALALANCLHPAAAQAQPRTALGGPRSIIMGGGGGTTLPLLLRGADLTADQKTQVRQIIANHRSAFRDLFTQLRALHDQISSKLVSTDPVSESDLTPQLEQVADLRRRLADEGLKVALEIRNLLTPDQLAKAAQLKTQMQSLRAQMRNLMAPQPATEQ